MHADSNKIVSDIQHSTNVFKGMNTFSSHESVIISFSNKLYLISLYFSYLENHSWITIIFIMEHTVKHLCDSNICLSFFSETEFKVFIFFCFACKFDICITVINKIIIAWIVCKKLDKLCFRQEKYSVIFVCVSDQFFNGRS